MNTTRKTMAGAALVLVLVPTVGSCGHNATSRPNAGGSVPTASAAPLPSPSGTAARSPTAVPTTPAPGSPATGEPSQVRVKLAYQWHWPNDPSRPGQVDHTTRVPPVPRLVSIDAADHRRDLGQPPFNRMSFTFTTGFPSYTFSYVDRLVGDGSGQPVPLAGRNVLRIVFHGAQAHNTDGTPSISSQPPPHLRLDRMVQYAAAGDFEGIVTYGIGIDWPGTTADARVAVRAYEVIRTDAADQNRYVVAIDVDTSPVR